MSDLTPTVAVSGLRKSFGSVQAVNAVSFEVYPGEIFGLLGPNGSGKTTTLRMALDIFRPDAGTVEVLGGELTDERKDRVGYLPEDRGLYTDAKLETVLVYLATLKGMDAAAARERLDGWLERLDLAAHREKKVQELSKGMQQKAQLIATLLHEPDLIIVDEPFSGLDPVNTRLVKEILDEQRRAGRTIIMSTHQMYQVEALCSRIALIHRGEVVLYGEVEDIRRRFAGHAVVVEGEGTFEGLPGVVEARRQDGAWHLALQADTDPQVVLRELVRRDDVTVERFEVAEASLEDIFVSVVTGGAGPPARDPADAAAAGDPMDGAAAAGDPAGDEAG
ncbi:MAG: ATP-binding cassette domain-containing protein [Thermoleophilia bacterium]|nr:ATP-binding cassette domain-containing protein [Thermoleophilia bacterium]